MQITVRIVYTRDKKLYAKKKCSGQINNNIHRKAELYPFISKQVRKKLVHLVKEKRLLIAAGCRVKKIRRICCLLRLSLLLDMGQRTEISYRKCREYRSWDVWQPGWLASLACTTILTELVFNSCFAVSSI